MNPRITIVSGTNRPDSTSLALSRHLEHIYSSNGAQIKLLDLGQISFGDLGPAAYETPSDTTRPDVRAVLDADGLLIVTPEYNGSFPGVLKLFIDILPFPAALEGKPSAFVGVAAGQWGALRAVEQLQAIFAYRNALLFPKRVFIPESDDNVIRGQPTQDYAQRLQQQATVFISYVRKHTES